MKMTVKTGDNVLVIAGKDKGKTGKVNAVYADSNKVLVEDVNIVSKHQKPRSQQDKGGIFKRPAPIDASNVLVVCPACGKATRVAHSEVEGKKVRTCKKCGASLDKEFKSAKKDSKKVKVSDLKNAELKAVKSEETEEKPVKKTTAKKSTTAKTTKSTATKSTAKKTEVKADAVAEEKPAKKTTTKKSTTAKKETK